MTPPEARYCGRMSYHEAQNIQKEELEKALQGGPGAILGFEFEPVITLGKRGSNLDLLNPDIEVVKVDRGGHATLHSPGQLVIYPVISLRDQDLGVKDFVCWMQKTSQRFFGSYNVPTFAREEPGLYTGHGKIAFFGIRVSRGVSQHGLSINVNNNKKLFEQIRSCGIESEKFDQLARFVSPLPTLEQLFSRWVACSRKGH